MKQSLAKTFGTPSCETASRIDDSDATNPACGNFEAQFEAKASELRSAFLADLAALREGEDA